MSEQYIVFDIETAPLAWGEFSESQQEYITRGAETEEEKEKKKFEMGLSPMTAQVVCIGLMVVEVNGEDAIIHSKGAFIVDNGMAEDEKREEFGEGEVKFVFSNEKKALEQFWAVLKKYSSATLVSFNGRSFDAPFLMLRSALLRVRPSRNLMQGTKYNYSMHCDLLDELTFFQAGFYGATKRFNFDFYTRSFGLVSPKAEGVDGKMVGDLFGRGEFIVIAEYCLRDVVATWELFEIWKKYLRYR